jgi:hypothetical protein
MQKKTADYHQRQTNSVIVDRCKLTAFDMAFKTVIYDSYLYRLRYLSIYRFWKVRSRFRIFKSSPEKIRYHKGCAKGLSSVYHSP